jgi:uncharacterized protein (DUF1501 family)
MHFRRRQFLKAAAAGGVAYALGRTPGVSLGQMSGVTGFADYKALVCLFLFGGNDSWNMLVPTSSGEYEAYAKSRGAGTPSSLAIEKESLLSISSGSTEGQYAFGFHPGMPEIRDLFMSGRVAVLPNVGPLIKPTTKDQYQNAERLNFDLPPQLFSHNDQQDQWHSLRGKALLTSGWAGRVADVLASQTGAQQMPLNVSLSGQTLFQSSLTVDPYVMGFDGVNTFQGLTVNPELDPYGYLYSLGRRQSVENVLAATLSDRTNTYYHRGYAKVQDRALRYVDRINKALSDAREFSSLPAPVENRGSPLKRQLRTVARMISKRADLSMSRQIFFVGLGGFDTHDFQLVDHPKLLREISSGVKAFFDAMAEIGMSEQVTLFTQSDFARTLTSNGDGSDHAWGGTQMVVGGAVRGGRIYGEYPLLEMGGPLEIGGGIMIPTISSDQYAATLASWFGVSPSNLPAVAPNVVNFSSRDLGFMV